MTRACQAGSYRVDTIKAPHSASRLASNEPYFITNASACTQALPSVEVTVTIGTTVSVVSLEPFLQENFLLSQGIVDHVFSFDDAANSEFFYQDHPAFIFLTYSLFLQSMRRFTSHHVGQICNVRHNLLA